MLRKLLLLWILLVTGISVPAHGNEQSPLCLDEFCIGQSINDTHFSQIDWGIPRENYTKEKCDGVGCQPDIAFYGYDHEQQNRLAEAVSWKYGLNQYTIVTKTNLDILRKYKYECNLSARGIFGERRFLGFYKSLPSGYLTIVGLRLIGGELKIYRIARQYPYQTQSELVELAKKMKTKYGSSLLLYNYLSSNAYSDVIQQSRNGWFGRSELFKPNDLSNNSAELVLIDPHTRPLLEPTSMPESGEIKPLPVHLAAQCSKPTHMQ